MAWQPPSTHEHDGDTIITGNYPEHPSNHSKSLTTLKQLISSAVPTACNTSESQQ